ncbi:hypothetical protein CIB48_g1654 [Xylaria polymorpha]|nr:hypothetical protein CIB48_g1654 [Xylaria polymorpha]
MSTGWKDVVGTSLKSQVKGLIGRDDSSSPREQHVAAPISSLRDPSSFGPPPKHVAARGGRAASRTKTVPSRHNWIVHVASASATDAIQCRGRKSIPRSVLTSPNNDNTGSRDGKAESPPSLPPRLPPRSENSTPSPTIASEQAASQGHLNQGAINRLGAAGISVPGLGIGGGGPPSQASVYGQVDELQARFARMGASPPTQAIGNETAATQQRPGGQAPPVLGKKKPPPPPIPKKPELSGNMGEGAATPPPVPLATRPRSD